MEFKQQRMSVNGIQLNVICEGDDNAPLIILLHGFPECWLSWKAQIKPLADAGYRVWAPDQRGYNLSDKPSAISDYRIDKLAADVEALRIAAGAEKFHLVGHDWGAAVAWWYGLHYSDHLRSLTAINVPHPVVFKRTLGRNPKQLLKSWYMFFFQLPKLPELLLSLGDFSRLAKGLKSSSNKGAFDQTLMNELKAAWRQPGALTGMLNWYRAAIRRPIKPDNVHISAPTRILWGVNDIALTPEMASASKDYCDQVELTYYPEATHWLPHDLPDTVTTEILQFCDAH